MRINLPLPTIILILYIVYVIFSMIMKKIRFNAENLEEVKKIISEDPFNINRIAEYEITEFFPTKYAEDFANFVK